MEMILKVIMIKSKRKKYDLEDNFMEVLPNFENSWIKILTFFLCFLFFVFKIQ